MRSSRSISPNRQMGCHVVKSSYAGLNNEQYNYYRNIGAPSSQASAAAMDNNQEVIVDTQPQTQSQSTNAWTNMDSQPIENVIWGRLYPKSVKLKSLDLCNNSFAAGRDDSNDLCLTKRELPEKILCRISKVHFSITKDGTDITNPVYIEDLSRNGTFLNGERIGHEQRRILLNDDVISLSHPHYKAFVYKDLSPNEAHGLPKLITERYHISRKLGAGACGIVRLVFDRHTCEPFAMKQIKKNQLIDAEKQRQANDPQQQPNQKPAAAGAKADSSTRRIENEAEIMRSLQHPCIVKMHDIVDSSESLFIMLELMQGGDLLSRIIGHQRLSEATAKLYFVQLCNAIKYLHDKNITHRDIKPDNVLLQTADEETLLKVGDFGLSKSVSADSVMRTLCGTPLYVAPEVLLTGGRGSYTNKVDIWSMGVVLFTCLSGTLPFSEDYGTPVAEQIKKADYKFRTTIWRHISTDAKTLISGMLTVRADRRLSIDQVLESRWLRDEKILRRAEDLMKMPLLLPQKESATTTTVAVATVAGSSRDTDNIMVPSLPIRMVATAAVVAPHPQQQQQRIAQKRMYRIEDELSLGVGELCVDEDDDDNDGYNANRENASPNFLQPPAAKRRRIEPM